jgi:dolichol kinase
MKKTLCILAGIAILLALCTRKEHFILLSIILTIFALLELLQSRKEKEKIWYKEIQEGKAEGRDWDDVDAAFFSEEIKNN